MQRAVGGRVEGHIMTAGNVYAPGGGHWGSPVHYYAFHSGGKVEHKLK